MRAGSFTRSSQELFALEKGVCLKKKQHLCLRNDALILRL